MTGCHTIDDPGFRFFAFEPRFPTMTDTHTRKDPWQRGQGELEVGRDAPAKSGIFPRMVVSHGGKPGLEGEEAEIRDDRSYGSQSYLNTARS